MNNNENNDQEYKGISQLPVARVQKIIKAELVLLFKVSISIYIYSVLYSKEMENCAKEAVFLISIATVRMNIFMRFLY